MSLPILLLIILVLAIGLTYLVGKIWQKKKSWTMSFIQNYVGILFIISGYVKAIDPLGTAYKMEDYFLAFESLFDHTWFSFITPMFPFFAEYSIVFSLLMIIFEIVLGIMLILGAFPKFTSWGFLSLIVLFLILTGYTYLTGYVPMEVSFWSFGDWASFDANNMKVTDCGCFGDFIKFAPFVSFMKDVVLMFPALYFVIFSNKMHQLSTKWIRTTMVISSTLILLLYNMQNYYWDLPHIDFRPFKSGVNIVEQQKAEAQAEAEVKEISVELKNKNDGQVVVIASEDFVYSDYPVEEWEYLDRVYSEPAIPHTKISDFAIEDFEGNDVTEDILNFTGLSIMVVCYKLPGKAKPVTVTVQDTSFRIDTIITEDNTEPQLVKTIDKIEERTINSYDYIWKKSFISSFRDIISPFIESAKEANIKTFIIVGGTEEQVADLIEDGAPQTDYYTADDILLKTIVRSNPGIVLLSNGRIVEKWHYKKLPDFEAFSHKIKIK